MFDISSMTVPAKISDLFVKANKQHFISRRPGSLASSQTGNFLQPQDWAKIKGLLPGF